MNFDIIFCLGLYLTKNERMRTRTRTKERNDGGEFNLEVHAMLLRRQHSSRFINFFSSSQCIDLLLCVEVVFFRCQKKEEEEQNEKTKKSERCGLSSMMRGSRHFFYTLSLSSVAFKRNDDGK